ncbi:MAG: DNA mismatch repair protein MutS, partial [Sphingobacteriaceae bacterium]
MTTKQQQIFEKYTEDAGQLNQHILVHKRSINQVSFYRLIVFFIGITIIYAIGSFGWPYILITVLLMSFLFMQLIIKQSKLQTELNFSENLLKVLQNEADHLTSAKNSYDNGAAFSDGSHPYTDDLDIFGESSLFHYTNRCNTQSG